MKTFILVMILRVATCIGNSQEARIQPRFEVVSIREVPRDAPMLYREAGFTPFKLGGQYIDARTNLQFMIIQAYEVESFNQLTGLPDWAKQQSYSVAAKPAEGFPVLPESQNIQQVHRMLRVMLEDRFHLRVRVDTRQGTVYHLDVANGGLKVKEAPPPEPPAKEGPVGAAIGDSGGRIVGEKSTISGMARMLTVFLKRPVIDRTGLTGYYNFDTKWSAPDPPDGMPPAPGLGPAGISLLISALQSEFGLRLTTAPAPVKYWVVEHVEPPTEN